MLGWFNDEHYICKQSFNGCSDMTGNFLRYYDIYLYSTLITRQGSGVKLDDAYIYHVHTLSLLLACLQNKHRRGRLYFQEREDDVDMNTSETTEYNTCMYNYQVISSTTFKIY
jgi:hypothetical protein